MGKLFPPSSGLRFIGKSSADNDQTGDGRDRQNDVDQEWCGRGAQNYPSIFREKLQDVDVAAKQRGNADEQKGCDVPEPMAGLAM